MNNAKKVGAISLVLLAMIGVGCAINSQQKSKGSSSQAEITNKPNDKNKPACLVDTKQKVSQILMVGPNFVDKNSEKVLEVGGLLVESDTQSGDAVMLADKMFIKPLIAGDIESASVNRIKSEECLTLSKINQMSNPDEIQKCARVMKRYGINTDLAPVLDPYTGLMKNDDRAFFGTDEERIEKANQYIDGLLAGKIVPIVKHYPGYTSDQNTDIESADAGNNWNDNTGIFIQVAGKYGNQIGVMVNSIKYADTGRQAVYSPEIYAEIRKNFQGIILTDDIGAVGAKLVDNDALSERISQAILAGADMVIINQGLGSKEEFALLVETLNEKASKDSKFFKELDRAFNDIWRFKKAREISKTQECNS